MLYNLAYQEKGVDLTAAGGLLAIPYIFALRFQCKRVASG